MKAIQFDGTNEQQVATFLQRECWIKCSGDLAVKIMPARLCDEARIDTVPIGYWVANSALGFRGGNIGIEIHAEEF